MRCYLLGMSFKFFNRHIDVLTQNERKEKAGVMRCYPAWHEFVMASAADEWRRLRQFDSNRPSLPLT